MRKKEFSKESGCQRTTRTAECSQKARRAIYRETLQALQQRRDPYEGCPDYQRPRPSEVDDRRDREIGEEVIDRPTEPVRGFHLTGHKWANTSKAIVAMLQNTMKACMLIFLEGELKHREE